MKGEVYCQEAYPCLGDIHTQALQDVSPTLLHAVIRKESSFNSRTISSAGAVGLTQMLPSTAKEVAKKINLPYSEDRLLNDDPFNVRVGARYLQTRLDEFGDNEVLALVSYNAGIKYALEWQTMFGDPRTSADPVEWMELLPFGETRNYVHRVLEAKWVYERILPGHRHSDEAREGKKKSFGEGLKARSYKNRTRNHNKDATSQSPKEQGAKDQERKNRRADRPSARSDTPEMSENQPAKKHPKARTRRTRAGQSHNSHKVRDNSTVKGPKTQTRTQLKSHGRRKEASTGHSLQNGSHPHKRHEKGATPKGRSSKERPQSA